MYQKAYERTDPKRAGFLKPGSPEEKQAVERFEKFLSILTAEGVRGETKNVYSADAYFSDTLKELSGAATIEDYLARTAESTESCTVDFLDLSSHDGEYYFRWMMHIKFKKFKKGEVQSSIGMTHIRFNKEGKVSFHQDYWDSGANLFEKIPVLGAVIRKIKGRL